MTQKTEQERQAANAAIHEQLTIAREAFKKAEELARENELSFSFEIGDGYGYYETYKNRDGSVDGYWDGWQGSQC